MNDYNKWLSDDCCCGGYNNNCTAHTEACDCENILLEISNLHTDINVVSGEVENKQDKLSAGTGIEITEDNVINCTANPDLSDYFTKEESDNRFQPIGNYLSGNALNGYATEQWVLDKHYITGVDLSNYATLQDIPTVPTNVSSFNNDAGYLTEHQPLKTINGEVISGSGNIVIEASGGSVTVDDHLDSGSTNPVENKVIVEALNDKLDASAYTPVSLSGYATEQWVEDKHYITGVDLSDYALKSEIPTVPTSNSAFTNDMHYITSAETANYITSGTAQTLINNAFYCCSEAEWSQISGNPQENVLYLIY